jgi:hypothetical protein
MLCGICTQRHLLRLWLLRQQQPGGSRSPAALNAQQTATMPPLEQHSHWRRLGPLEEEQVELTALLGRGSFGRVYRGVFSCPCSQCCRDKHDEGALLLCMSCGWGEFKALL